MDQCEDREEGVPPSKSTLCGEHESQTKAQRKKRRRRKRKPETETKPGPPASSVSLQSDESKGDGRPPAKRSKMEASVKEQLLGVLDDLRKKELKRFHWHLQNGGDFTPIKKSRLEKASRTRTVDVMVETYPTDRVMEVARLILKKMKKGTPSASSRPSESEGSRWALEPIPAVIGREAGYALDRLPVCRRANTQGQTTIRTHIHSHIHT